ncbi:hypothetical protein SSBR45G_62500 [Bradyrhizobium sp. SSBR45G]|uniref:hypothetical protein n=1 Tax=unclassified Bradyrhizobium TaxID=2631580 RepID=UPI002342A534|nr:MULTISPECIES: hypothetical protein [unclassified Bradyrhizobium]GLH81341.1 hypothetical protein SSBR45G_62500 [Bradyrhizobium sp. SSBR45G]GLH88757.1 hypothetical protein SSBR45R_62180 [Bradyrhizobium sp. SSBR45R]
MRAQSRALSNPVALWWAMLTLVSLANIAFWFILYRQLNGGGSGALGPSSETGSMLVLSGAYVFGCAFRSVLPRADVQRICLVDSWLSSIFVGRSVATIAEIAFAAQWAIILAQLGAIADAETAINMARIIVPLIVVAEICSWYAVVTKNFLYNAIENSLWAVAFLFVGIGLGRLLPEFDGVVRWLLIAGLVGIACYLAFLVVVDVPMYVKRWRIERAAGTPLLHPLVGLRDSATRWTVTHDIAHWREEIAWMSLYFSAAVWGSLALCALSAMNDQLPNKHAQATAPAAIERPATLR